MIEHPFIDSEGLSNKTLEECQETLSSLTNKISFAYTISSSITNGNYQL